MADGSRRIPDLTIGPVDVRIDARDVAAYAEATALSAPPRADRRVPATFPAIWLWHPRAAAAISEAAKDSRGAPLLTAQRFEYRQRMRIGATYRFLISRFVDRPARGSIDIEARVEDLEGRVVATFAATYLIVETMQAEEIA